MVISLDQIKALRDETGISVIQCKKALEEAKGDLSKALLALRRRGAEVAAKKSDRTFGAGTVAAYIHAGGAVGAMAELLTETDFVAKNEEFQKLAYDIAMHVAALNPEFVRKEDVPEEARAAARELFEKEVEGKPLNLKGKILEGKLSAFFKERILLEQSFVKNPDLTVRDLVEAASQKFGERITIARVARFSVLGR